MCDVGNSVVPAAVTCDSLEARVYRNEKGESLPYRLLTPPGYDPARRYPIVLFLHGAGERGDDNEAQLKYAEVLRLVGEDVSARHPSFLVAPQCPQGERWVEVAWDRPAPHFTPEEPSRPMRLVMEMLDCLEEEVSIDSARRYATGFSMGGYGTFDLCVRRPGAFAAAAPICGGGDVTRAADIAGTAFWLFHGAADESVPARLSREMAKALRRAGANVQYTEYPGVGHASWTPAYNEPGLPDWLFSQRREQAK